jgi:prepilin-type N-terminal cleavage/methylation domain-containing protein
MGIKRLKGGETTMSMLRNRKGFTLVELMVVVIIVLVLAGIAVPVYIHYIQEGKKSEGYAVIDSVVSGALVYFQKYDTYSGGTFDNGLAADDVGNAVYFTYAISNANDNGFVVTATVTGGWGPAGATITWTQSGASAANGDAGVGSFTEAGW